MVLLARRALLALEILNAIFLELQEGCGGSRAGAWMEVSLMAIPAAHPGGTRAAAPSQSSQPARALSQGRQDMSPSLGADADGASAMSSEAALALHSLSRGLK